MSDEPTDVEVLPHWRDTADAFVEAAYAPGSVIPHEWFYERLRIAKPQPTTPYEQAQQSEFAYLRDMTAVRDHLLREHCIALRSRPGEGYEVVPPREQVAWAAKRAHERAMREMAKGLDAIVHVQTDALDDGEKKARMDAIAHQSALRQILSRRRTLPTLVADTRTKKKREDNG